MNNVEFFTVTELNGTETDWVKITVGENSYVWQPKSVYDQQLANLPEVKETPEPEAE
jgi:hypothetical protein